MTYFLVSVVCKEDWRQKSCIQYTETCNICCLDYYGYQSESQGSDLFGQQIKLIHWDCVNLAWLNPIQLLDLFLMTSWLYFYVELITLRARYSSLFGNCHFLLFLKVGQTRPLFNLFLSFRGTIKQNFFLISAGFET